MAIESLRLPSTHLPDLSGRWSIPAALAGCAVAGFGIALTLQARLGLGPFDVLHDGVSQQLGVTFGTAGVAMSTLAVLIGWRLGGVVGSGTLLAMVLVGPMVDGWRLVLPEMQGLAPRFAALLIGMVVIAFGLSLLVAAGRGPGPLEVLMLGLSGRGVPLRWVRTALEVGLFATGALLGGQIGVGTVVIGLGIGHLIAAFVPRGIR